MSSEVQSRSVETLREEDKVNLSPFIEKMEERGFDTREPSILEVADLEGIPANYHPFLDKIIVPEQIWQEDRDKDELNNDFYIFKSLAGMYQNDQRIIGENEAEDLENTFQRIDEGWKQYREASVLEERVSPIEEKELRKADGMLKVEKEKLEDLKPWEVDELLLEEGEVPEELVEWRENRLQYERSDFAFPYFVGTVALDLSEEEYQEKVLEDIEDELDGNGSEISTAYRDFMEEYANKRDERDYTRDEAIKEVVDQHMSEISKRQMMAR